MTALREWITRILTILSRTQLGLLAGSLSFTTLLSIIPFFAVIFGLVNALDRFHYLSPRIEGLFLDHLSGTVGEQAANWVTNAVQRIQDTNVGFWGVVFLILGSFQVLRDLDLGVQIIFGRKSKRSIWRRYLFYWLSILVLPFIAAVFVTITAIPIFGTTIGFTGDGWFFLLVILVLIQKMLPPAQVHWNSAFRGALVSLAGLFLLQSFFGLLTRRVFNYSKVYGSIAALPAFMIYVLIAWYIILAGLIVNAVLTQKQTRKDLASKPVTPQA